MISYFGMTEEKKKIKVSPKPKEKDPLVFAVIKTGGKQYIVETGKFYDFEKLPGAEGEKIEFDDVMLVSSGDEVKVGKPKIEGAKVTGKVLSQFQDEKVDVFKFKKRKRYRKSYGHRQELTKVEIIDIK
jgi:large subunit ribosomal protein L21